MQDYMNYRWFYTSSNKLVVGGKNDEQNELVLKNFLKEDYIVIHTTNPGSPFMIIQSYNPTKKDIDETAVFCSCFSKSWKLGSKKIDVDVFKGSQIFKTKNMKTGTFGVKGSKKTIKVKPELFLVIQKGKLRAIPKTKKENVLAEITPGKMSKEQAVEKIYILLKNKFNFSISKEEIMRAIPSNNLNIKTLEM
ncbi:MAG: NFACT RNA binding domain-containing protein [Nanoarchaeota archaeon]